MIRPYERSVYLMALSFLQNEADAEDVAQEAFLKAYRSLANFRGDSKFGTWLISITLNEARGRLRRLKRPMESLDEPPDEEGPFRRHCCGIGVRFLPRLWNGMRFGICCTTPWTGCLLIYREIFLLRDVEELSIAEAAQLLQITDGLVKVRLHRARTLLQKTFGATSDTAPHQRLSGGGSHGHRLQACA